MVTNIMSRMRGRKLKNYTLCGSYYFLGFFVPCLTAGQTIPLEVRVIQNSLDWIDLLSVRNNKQIVSNSYKEGLLKQLLESKPIKQTKNE
jgi:hypothetical protein